MTTSGLQPVEDNLEPTKIERRATALKEVRIRAALLNGLFAKDQKERENALNNITKLVRDWAKEHYPSELGRSTAGTVTRTTEGDIYGVSSPLYNNNSSKRSSISDGNNPLNSPLFTDGSGSASASSYTASPVVDSGFNGTPNIYTSFQNANDEAVDFNENNYANTREFGNSDGPVSEPFQRRGSSDEKLADELMKVEERKERLERLRLLILTMLRMSIDCPFPDIRTAFNKCLNKLRSMDVPVPEPVNLYPSCYIAPEDTITLEWPPSEHAINSPPRTTTPSGRSRSSSCSSTSSFNSSFSEEIPRIIQQLTPSIPLPSSPAIMPLGRQPDEMTRNLMIDTFINIGRLSHFYRVLAYFPSFMEKYQKSYNSIIRNHAGPLPVSWRVYIGIMASSQHKCHYAVSKLTDDFILCGGDVDWLRGLDHVPIKIRNLAKLNTILAHQPWLLQASHIGELARGAENKSDNWTLSEIVHAIVILSTFHGLSSYALGCGIVPEYDSIEGNREQPFYEEPGSSVGIMNPEDISPHVASGMGIRIPEPPGESDTENTEETTVESAKPIAIKNEPSPTLKQPDVETVVTIRQTKELIERLKKHELQISTEDLGLVPSDSTSKVYFENVEEETFEDTPREEPSSPYIPEEFFSTSVPNPYTLAFDSAKKDYFARFLDSKVEIPYQDFDVNSNEYKVFKLGDYGWETLGVAMVNKFLPSVGEDIGIGDLLDREFSEIRDLTDYRLFHSFKSSNIDLDTKPLRQAVWFYVQRLYGLLKDDYEYRDLNTFLNKKIKKFLKKVSCKPEEIKFKDWRNIGFNLREEEKCHVSLIAVEARKQAELVYGLSSVTKYDNER